jgi:hypothetical protein
MRVRANNIMTVFLLWATLAVFDAFPTGSPHTAILMVPIAVLGAMKQITG